MYLDLTILVDAAPLLSYTRDYDRHRVPALGVRWKCRFCRGKNLSVHPLGTCRQKKTAESAVLN